MEKRLTNQQLTQIVGEVERLANRDQEELDRSEVQKILLELNLPPELLDDAMIQISRKEALVQQHQRNRQIAIAGAVVGSLLVIGSLLFLQNKSQTLDKVSASSDRLTLGADRRTDLRVVSKGSELTYLVTLNDAPVGEKLALNCDWRDPTGKTVHSNNFETKNITAPVWNTQCRYQLPGNAPSGAWQVQIKTGERLIKQAPFAVK
jgi:hypothetical protein